MSVVDTLMETAKADTDLLRTLDSQGDHFATPRDVDFLLRAPSREKAEIVSGFINDYQFGTASLQEQDGQYSVLVIINMAIQQQAILSVSGFMGCICALFGLEYDGWGCVAQAHS
ncbi:ribonuclease E inhibitor RraB [Dyella sp.]|uniref:ribonuclease E inhibitor RraB n=1 Tax=Dyella sp. TaxID=1869338 RepID=UPI003F7E23FC